MPASETQCPRGLFDRIISAVRREQEFRQTRKILASFSLLFAISAAVLPLSFEYLAAQWQKSGIPIFISMAVNHLNTLAFYGQDFFFAIIESLPIIAIIIFIINAAAFLFVVKLFLHRKGLLIRYLSYQFNLGHGQ